MAFLKYEDVLLKVAGESIFAQQASINVNTSLQPVRLIDGTIHRYAPTNGAKGTLSFSHYLTGSIASFLDVTGVAETSTNGSFGGLTCFLSKKLTRESIWNSLLRRHHYGTTGNRIFMDVKVLEAKDVAEIATLPTLDEARANIVGILSASASKLVSILLARSEKMSNLSTENSEKQPKE